MKKTIEELAVEFVLARREKINERRARNALLDKCKAENLGLNSCVYRDEVRKEVGGNPVDLCDLCKESKVHEERFKRQAQKTYDLARRLEEAVMRKKRRAES